MKKISLILAWCFLLTACNSSNHDRDALKKEYKEFWKNSTRPDIARARHLDATFKQYFLQHPSDTSIPAFMYEDARLNITALQNVNEGIRLLEKVVKDYPAHRLVPDAIFVEAFTYEQSYHNDSLARIKYQEIIDKFPNHPYAEQARKSIKYLGKDPNEIIKHLLDSIKNSSKQPSAMNNPKEDNSLKTLPEQK